MMMAAMQSTATMEMPLNLASLSSLRCKLRGRMMIVHRVKVK